GRDNARTPMQWSADKNAGFTTGIPWFGVNPNYKMIHADSQIKDKSSIFHTYKKLISLRKEYEVIVYGDFQLLYEEDEDIFAYTRTLEKNKTFEKLLVVCNFHDKERTVNMEELKQKKQLLISNYELVKEEHLLRPYEARMYLLA
ncbi:glucohydrolase, partial [Lachnotalea glycerini]